MTTERPMLREVSLSRPRGRRRAGAGPSPAATSLALPLPMPLLGCAPNALENLRRLTLAVVGCGSVGGRIALHLARLGVGGLMLIDPKRYKPASLVTHDIDPGNVGQLKASVVADRCKAINPVARVRAFAGPVEALDLPALAGTDLVIMAPDLLAVEVAVAQTCLWLGLRLIHASVHGPTLTAHIRTFLNARAVGGCPACLFGRDEWELMTRQVRFSCENAGAKAGLPAGDAVASPAPSAPATNSMSPLCSAAADLAVIQLLRLLLPAGAAVGDSILEYCGFTHRTHLTPIARNPQCRLDHTALTRLTLTGSAFHRSLAQWFEQGFGTMPGPEARFEIPGFQWVEFAACRCPQPSLVRRFLSRLGGRLGACEKCAAPRTPLEFHSYRIISCELLGSAVTTPLPALGVRRAASVIVRNGEIGCLIQSGPSPPPST